MNWQLRYCLRAFEIALSAPGPPARTSSPCRRCPGCACVAMLRRSTLAVLSGMTLRWNGGESLFMCQRSTRKPRSSRSIVDRLRDEGVLLASRRASSCARTRDARSRSGCPRSAGSSRRSAGRPECPSSAGRCRYGKSTICDGSARAGITHPDPDQVVALDDRVTAHAQLGRDHVLARDLRAAPGRIEPDAVVHAAHAVALDGDPSTAARRGAGSGRAARRPGRCRP